jgi:beta-glucosidase
MANEVVFLDIVESESEEEREEKIRRLVSRMSPGEKVAQMVGSINWLTLVTMAFHYGWKTFDSGANKRLGIPPIKFTDGPRGVCLGHSTCFPVAMARGATFDPELQERIGSAIGVEARSQGANYYGGVCINLLRHPGWGRAQETYGEDPFHLKMMGVAALNGAQRHLMACAKHFACNSIEESRFYVDVRVDERTLREIYLPHFRACVEAGAASVMSAYNRVNGEYCGHNIHLLRDILKEEWGFDGFVMSDFIWGLRDGPAGLRGGLDVEMPKRWRYGFGFMRAVKRGKVDAGLIDEAVTRILRQKARFAQVGEAGAYGREKVACREHTELALEAARNGIVLLRNEGAALPLDRERLKSVAVIGRLADRANIGDRGSSRVSPPYVVTPLEGMRNRSAGRVEIIHEDGLDIEHACRAARRADAVVVVAGLTYREEGEYISSLSRVGGDRMELGLQPGDQELIKAVAAETKRCIVVLEGGSAITMQGWQEEVEAVLMAWYPGMEGGNAIADILFGDINPSGRLPLTFPVSAGQLPPFDKKAKTMEYGYYHGYRHFDREGLIPAYPFGFGLSYTSYEYAGLELEPDEIGGDGKSTASLMVTNAGDRAGVETVQLYVGCPGKRVDRPVKELKGFERVALEPGESARVAFEIEAAALAYYHSEKAAWEVEEGEYTLYAGSSSRDEDLSLRATLTIS